jgi:hypothetical protein
LIEVSYALSIFFEQLGFAWYGFFSLDEIQNGDGSTVAFEEVIKVLCRSGIKRVDDAD